MPRLPALRPVHVALLLPWLVAVVAARRPVGDNSFLWHVRAGEVQADLGAVLTSDPFSFTAGGEEWRTQSWLLELAYSALEDLSGLGFVPWLVASVTTATFGAVLLAAWKRTRSLEATALTGVLTAWLGAIFLNPRPVLISYLLFAVVVLISGDRRLRWALPLIAWVWGSVHASLVLGLGYVLVDGFRRRDRKALTDVLAMTFAASLGAHGLGMWQFLLDFARDRSALSLITEWRTPNFTSVEFVPFLLGLMLLLIGAMSERVRPWDLWIVAPFVAFAASSTRSVLPAWIALAPLVATGFSGVPRSTHVSRRGLSPIALLTMSLIVLPLILPLREHELAPAFPQEASRQLTGERLFHNDMDGGYLIYALWPDRKVFVDDRAELYGEEHLRQVVETRNGTPMWREVFGRWEIDEALLRPDDGLLNALKMDGWTETYRDEEHVILRPPA